MDRYIERATLYSYGFVDIVMFVRYVWLVPLPGYSDRYTIARPTFEEARGKQCGRECTCRGEAASTLHL